MAIDVDNKVGLLCEDFIFLNKCSEVGIYKRNQGSKKTRKRNKQKNKQELDQESDKKQNFSFYLG